MAEDDFAEETNEEEGIDTLDDAELDEDELDDEELEDPVLEADAFDDDSVAFEGDTEDEGAPKAATTDSDDEDEDLDPADLEADLDAILKDRLATPDDEEEDVEPENAITGVKPADITSKREDEFVCSECFLVVNQSQFGSKSNPRCPMGDPDCPSMALLFGS